ncbi:MAG: biopolymer transporter ExbD [Methylacidiphilales bacterium]|nr:biopolymer transporter ExbD [Candidatus Methylacidiphilales bacterium]
MNSARRRLRRPHLEEVGLQIAPMIDVTMLLLFFFMLTGKLMQGQKLKTIALPLAASAGIPKDISGRDVVNIDGTGKIYAGDQLVTPKELKSYLKKRLKECPPLKIYVRADAHTPAVQIKQIMRSAAEAGAIEVAFGAYQK